MIIFMVQKAIKKIHIKSLTRCNSVSKFKFVFIWSSTRFRRHTAHHQEPKTALAASGFAYVGSCWPCSCWTLTAQSKILIHYCILLDFYVNYTMMHGSTNIKFNPLNAELNPICYLLALLAQNFLHVSRIRVKSLTLRLLMSYIYMEHIFLMFLDHTQRRTTVGRTPLDEQSARRRDLYLTTHNIFGILTFDD